MSLTAVTSAGVSHGFFGGVVVMELTIWKGFIYALTLTCSETCAKCQSVIAIYAFTAMSVMNCVSRVV